MTLAFPKPRFRADKKKAKNAAKRAWEVLKAIVLGLDNHTCQNPDCRVATNDPPHHIIKRSLGGPDEVWDLITFCCECHRRADNDPAFVIEILEAKQKEPGFRHERALRELRMRNWKLEKTA